MNKYLFLTFLVFVISLVIFSTAIFKLDPRGPQIGITYSAFLIGLFFGAASFFTFIFFFALELFYKSKIGIKGYLISLRRGTLVAIFLTAAAGLKLFQVFGLVEAILLALFLSLIEYSAVAGYVEEKSV